MQMLDIMPGTRAEILPALLADIVARLVADHASYQAMCETDREQGHRPRSCEHGTNRWTDYDNICGGCEEGYTNDTADDRLRNALAETERRYAYAVELANGFRRYEQLKAPNLGDLFTFTCEAVARALDADSQWATPFYPYN